MNTKLFISVLLLYAATLSASRAESLNASQAENLVKSASCTDGETVDAALQKKASSWQRDLGWQVFEENGAYAVEKSLLISKSIQLRFRWLVDAQGKVSASSDRAKDLCGQSS